ncbi:NAD(P)H-dependent oxidoreductase [Emticicia sp. CRIBPO]|uniref:NAD(P)H-dependent oxidoreductase n=1 Tax=Emticicia sp. CRIBPO TaxID=2683258 RepID=UPI0014135120|nr:NAD(P)H-dependent oxidoreductase [Emticicia sp. CRIBPO]NBA86655.1 NAD(P)H-dependent oxidoreductase [Emticicia sp. CRIBPO]
MDLIEALNWRYATKKFADKKLSDEKLQKILDAIALSASSAGMQTYRVFVIENPDIRKELASDSFNPQIVDSSHLLLFAAYDSIDQEIIDDYIHFVARERGLAVENLADFKKSLESHLLIRTDEENFIWSSKQAYIALGTGLIAAAELQVDATPMEGFNSEKLDKILGLKEKGLKSVVLLSLGYRDEENDYFAKLKKVRLPKEEFVIEVV